MHVTAVYVKKGLTEDSLQLTVTQSYISVCHRGEVTPFLFVCMFIFENNEGKEIILLLKLPEQLNQEAAGSCNTGYPPLI